MTANLAAPLNRPVVVIGGGPAGLSAAETIATAGRAVVVVERMPSPGRKFLMAGRGGLNLTHSETLPALLAHYGPAAPHLRPLIEAYPPAALVAWCEGLAQPTFVGSSGRVFPQAMKSSPLLRAWLRRLQGLGVGLLGGRRWIGWHEGVLRLDDGTSIDAAAVVLACGGASWPRLGSDGGWTGLLDVACAPLRPANMGVLVEWSAPLRARFAGTPLKRVALSHESTRVRGEAVLSATGLEGGAVYALSSALRDTIERHGTARLLLDLRPDLDGATLAARLHRPRGSESLSTFLRKAAELPPVAIALVQEARHAGAPGDIASLVKSLPLTVVGVQDLTRAISTAGGILWDELDEHLMLRRHPGVFAAGEMIDWDAPTGGYLLQACFSTGVAAGRGVLAWLAARGR